MMPSAGVPLFQTDLFVPRYRPMRHGAWELRVTAMGFAPGYWSQSVFMTEMAVMLRDNASWMSLTPFEVESQEIGLRLAHGHVLICGLGMGWAAAVSALRDETTAVTVVERDADVIALHRELDIFAQLPEAARGKIRIEQGDAFAYVPDRPVDMLMPDIWLPLVSEGRVDEVRRMQANVRAGAIYFWGQEMEIARHAAAAGRALDADGVAATVADFGLPLLGTERADYPEKIGIVARRWMQDRWLPGTPPA
jgi:voltage-gated potassium channel Kch